MNFENPIDNIMEFIGHRRVGEINEAMDSIAHLYPGEEVKQPDVETLGMSAVGSSLSEKSTPQVETAGQPVEASISNMADYEEQRQPQPQLSATDTSPDLQSEASLSDIQALQEQNRLRNQSRLDAEAAAEQSGPIDWGKAA